MDNSMFKDFIREVVREEMQQLQNGPRLESIAKFCSDKGISRTTLWRDIKNGNTKTVRIGSRVFIDVNQFAG